MGKSTHFTHTTSQLMRLGGVAISHKGAQDVQPNGVPSNWYPVNLPTATAGTPQNSDCLRLLNSLAPLVAKLTIQQSVALALAYRTVQSGVSLTGNFTVNGATGPSNTMFDNSQAIGELVAVDVVNKNPALVCDLALRLAKMTAIYMDRQLFGLYSSASGASVGAQGTTPTAASLTTALGELPVTGEPVFAIFQPAILTSMETTYPSGVFTAGSLPIGAYQALINDSATIGIAVGTPAANKRPIRFLASESVPVLGSATPTVHNLMALPSFWALATADLGTQFGQTSGNWPSLPGTTQIVTSTALDPEFGTPQLSLQLVMSNSGSGAQIVYVNAQFAALAVNPANAVQILA